MIDDNENEKRSRNRKRRIERKFKIDDKLKTFFKQNSNRKEKEKKYS